MVAEQILQRLEAEFDNPPEQIRAVADLLDAGASPEFVVLFRRDETGDPGEERVGAIAERLRFLVELEQRKTTLLEQAAERGHDVEDLRGLLQDSVDQDLLDDVDHFLRPHEHKAEAQVARLGLGPLVDTIHSHDLGGRLAQDLALEYVRPDQPGLADADQVLAQVVLALAERYGEDPALRTRMRGELSRGILTATAATPSRGGSPRAAAPEAAAPVDAVDGSGPETATADAPVDEPGAGVEAPSAEAPAAEAPEFEALAPEATASGTEAVEPSGTAASAPETSIGDTPTSDAPTVDSPAAGEPAAEVQAGAIPAAEVPAGEVPAAETPVAEVPAGEVPAAETPAAEAPAGETPAAEAEPTAPETAGSEASSASLEESVTFAEAPTKAPTGDPGAAGSADAAQRTEPAPKAKRAKAGPKPKKGSGRFQQLLGIQEPVRRISASRMLALRHAEREGILQLKLVLPPGRELELFRDRFSPDVDPTSALGRFLDLVYGHAYDTYLHRPCEQTVRHHIKEKADRETVRAFARSLRAQLMSPVVEDGAVAALRVAGRSAWLAIVGADGATRARHTFPVPDNAEGRAELVKHLADAMKAESPKALAIPHGRREGPAKELAREVFDAMVADGAERPLLVPVDETAAVVWATSPQARRRHAQTDTGMRTTLSLARRVRDPLFELMRVEPRGLGLGQNLTEVHQGMLRRQLDATLTACLARIGIDVNRADPTLLARAPGVSRDLAKAISQDRAANGSFKTLEELKRVPAVDDATFVRIAGFLRIHDGDDPFDATAIPPENRPLVARIAERESVTPVELIGREQRGPRAEELADEEFGFLRCRDTLDDLRRGAHDPRGRVESLRNDGVQTFADLRVAQQLQGRVTNLAEFGAFIDLGVGQDGLVHVSQIPGSRLRDPSRILCVGEIVRVYVVHLEPDSRKIGLSMLKPRHLAEGRPATLGERMGGGQRGGGGGGGGRGRPRSGDRPQQQPAVMTRAARAPEGRRGEMRRGPKPPRPKGDDRGDGGRSDDRRGRPMRGGGRGGPPGAPRVITVESDKVQEAPRGHKGELRSLASLKSLLSSSPPKDDTGPGDAGQAD